MAWRVAPSASEIELFAWVSIPSTVTFFRCIIHEKASGKKILNFLEQSVAKVVSAPDRRQHLGERTRKRNYSMFLRDYCTWYVSIIGICFRLDGTNMLLEARGYKVSQTSTGVGPLLTSRIYIRINLS